MAQRSTIQEVLLIYSCTDNCIWLEMGMILVDHTVQGTIVEHCKVFRHSLLQKIKTLVAFTNKNKFQFGYKDN